jgi:hypothetical protein
MSLSGPREHPNQATEMSGGVKARNVRGFREKEPDSWPRKGGLAGPGSATL